MESINNHDIEPIMCALSDLLVHAAFDGDTEKCAAIRDFIVLKNMKSRRINICELFAVAMVAKKSETAQYLAEWMRELPIKERAPLILDDARWSKECLAITRGINAHSRNLARVAEELMACVPMLE